MSPSAAKERDQAPPNPLERFTSGGWVKGMLRLAVGLALVGVVVWFTGAGSLTLLLDPQVAFWLVVGAAVQIGLRVCRILKWSRIIEPAGLVPRPWTYLLRIQLIGMLGNVLLPMSEPLKVWAVAANRRQVLWASESIVIETTVHACLVGVAGCLGLLLTGWTAPAPVWWAAGGMAAIPVVLIAGLRWWPRRQRPAFHIVDLRVIGWAAGETACQLAVYALAVRAIGVDIQLGQLLALGPLLFVTDVAMVTPSGLGVREAVYAVVLQSLSGAPPEAAVAVGLLVSTMLMVAAIVGGGVALALPRPSSAAPNAE
ncbi:MAG: flippase-like domain-containing protein [Deltaproteobacteria bacterium]|nr:flippase-like domain-containing protein [Deltaproteobacteria bacterium]